jgi:glycosyltransferase involved in cell wall biosynthesis
MIITNAEVHDKRVRLAGLRIIWIGSMVSGFNTYQTSLLEMLSHLEKRGHDITLVGTRPRHPLFTGKSNVKTTFIPLKYLPAVSPALFTLFAVLYLPFTIARRSPDFVFFQPDITVLASLPALLASKLKRVRLILDIRSTPVETFGIRGLLQKVGFNVSVNVAKRTFSGITIITPLMKQQLCQTFDIRPSNVGVWTSGVSTIHFDPQAWASHAEELRKELGLNGKFVVFYHGAFSANRGLQQTVKAMSILKSDAPETVLFLLGAGPISAQLRDLVMSEGLEGRLIIHKPVPYLEVPKFIAASDVCISPLPSHPYWRYQCPLKLLEYMAMGKTVILSDIPAHRSVTDNSPCAVYTASTQPKDIADSILYTYENREKLVEWGRLGMEIVRSRYVWEKVAKDLEDYLLTV